MASGRYCAWMREKSNMGARLLIPVPQPNGEAKPGERLLAAPAQVPESSAHAGRRHEQAERQSNPDAEPLQVKGKGEDQSHRRAGKPVAGASDPHGRACILE